MHLYPNIPYVRYEHLPELVDTTGEKITKDIVAVQVALRVVFGGGVPRR
jgi:hypothetical protein